MGEAHNFYDLQPVQRLWYSFLRVYVRVGLHFYFKKIQIHGKENIPEGPVIFAANHQNAFMDALLIVCFNSHITHSLSRADIFKKPFARWFLSNLNMIPVYRIRDGRQSLAENKKTFEACSELFRRNEAVVIFPEGNHGPRRRLRPLSKGFTRVAFEAIQKNPTMKISIIPVGLNYSSHQVFRSSVSVYFGESIPANDYFAQLESNDLRNELALGLKRLVTHVEDDERYEAIIQQLEITNPNYLDPISCNERIARIEKGDTIPIHQVAPHPMAITWPLYFLTLLINFIPLMIWRNIKMRIKDPVFIASMRFGIGIFLFPFFYLAIGLLLSFLWGFQGLVIWLILSFPSMLFYDRTR